MLIIASELKSRGGSIKDFRKISDFLPSSPRPHLYYRIHATSLGRPHFHYTRPPPMWKSYTDAHKKEPSRRVSAQSMNRNRPTSNGEPLTRTFYAPPPSWRGCNQGRKGGRKGCCSLGSNWFRTHARVRTMSMGWGHAHRCYLRLMGQGRKNLV